MGVREKCARTKSTVAGLAAILLSSGCWAGTIDGKLNAGGPLTGTVVVVYTRAVTPPGAQGPQTGIAVAAKDGTFQIDGLSEGLYSLCIQGAGHDYVDPCLWAATPPQVELKTAKATAKTQIDLKEGVRVRVNLNDPKGLLMAASRPAARGRVRAGVWLRNGFHLDMARVSQAEGGEAYEILAPEDESLHVSVTTEGLRLKDDAGRGLERGIVALAVVTKKGEKRKTVDLVAEDENGN